MVVLSVDYLIQLFMTWLGLFTAPARHFELLWILIPVYAAWIFTDFYQEKRGTSFGNAISNGIVPLWVGVDWGKTLFHMLKEGTVGMGMDFASRIVLVLVLILYGLTIIISGIKVKKITKYIGRIREVSYACIVLTPVFYGFVPLNAETAISIVLFFPLFYGIVELINRLVPNPPTYEEEEMPSAGTDFPGAESPGSELPGMDMSGQMGGGMYGQQGYGQQGQGQQPQQGQYPPGQYPPGQYPPGQGGY